MKVNSILCLILFFAIASALRPATTPFPSQLKQFHHAFLRDLEGSSGELDDSSNGGNSATSTEYNGGTVAESASAEVTSSEFNPYLGGAGFCGTLTCASGQNAKCGYSFNPIATTFCTDPVYSYCQLGQLDENTMSISGTCIKPGSLAVGALCRDDEVCASGFCQFSFGGYAIKRRGAGESEGAQSAVGGDGSAGAGGACASPKSNGQACNVDTQCASGFCNGGNCTAKLADGAACEAFDNQCQNTCVVTASSTGVCGQAQKVYGQTCYSTDCANGLVCAQTHFNVTFNGKSFVEFQQGICLNPNITSKADGQACIANFECENNRCSSGSCVSAKQGGFCVISTFGDDNCVAGSYCNPSTKQCVASLSLGASCDNTISSSSQCGSTAYCSASAATSKKVGNATLYTPTSYKCTSPFSGTAGSICEDTSDCGDNLACSVSTGTLGTCQSVPASSKQSCTKDSNCLAGEKCRCDFATGKQECFNPTLANPAGTATAFQALETCVLNSGCSLSDEACFIAKCQSQFCAVDMLSTKAYLNLYGALLPSCVLGSSIFSDFSQKQFCAQPANIEKVSLTVSGTCAATSAAVEAQMSSSFSVSGSITCTDSSKRDASATYSASLSTPVSQSTFNTAIAAVSNNLASSGITVKATNAVVTPTSPPTSSPTKSTSDAHAIAPALLLTLAVFFAL